MCNFFSCNVNTKTKTNILLIYFISIDKRIKCNFFRTVFLVRLTALSAKTFCNLEFNTKILVKLLHAKNIKQ